MNTIDGIIRDLELKESYVGGCTTKGEIIIYLENLKILQKEKETVLKALEDVRAEIEADIEFNKDKKGLVNLLGQGKMMAVQIINRKIKEIEHD